MEIKLWTETERQVFQKVVQLAESNGSVDWCQVYNSQLLLNRFANQDDCKQTYQKLLQEQIIEKRKQILFGQWSPQQLLIMVLVHSILDDDWNGIRTIFFQDKSVEEVQQQYEMYKTRDDNHINQLITSRFLPPDFYNETQLINQHQKKFLEKYYKQLNDYCKQVSSSPAIARGEFDTIHDINFYVLDSLHTSIINNDECVDEVDIQEYKRQLRKSKELDNMVRSEIK